MFIKNASGRHLRLIIMNLTICIPRNFAFYFCRLQIFVFNLLFQQNKNAIRVYSLDPDHVRLFSFHHNECTMDIISNLYSLFEIDHTVKPRLFEVPGTAGILSNNR